jgi:6-phosphogluconolactonase
MKNNKAEQSSLPDGQNGQSEPATSMVEGISLEKIDQQPVGGKSPCHMVVDSTRRLIAVANYSSGSATIVAYDETGKILQTDDLKQQIIQHKGHGTDPSRQKQAHLHHATLSESGSQLNLVDLGIDQIVSYPWPITPERAAETEPLSRIITPPGRGPRHIVLTKDDGRLYAVTEMGCTVLFYEKENGAYQLRQEIKTLPEDFTGSTTCAAIWMTPDGHWLLASNRGHDSLAIYRVADDGSLTLRGIAPSGGQTPRDFRIVPVPGSRDYWILAASQDEDRISTYRLDGQTGEMSQLVSVLPLPAPVCLLPI